jgi:hypothetical protein
MYEADMIKLAAYNQLKRIYQVIICFYFITHVLELIKINYYYLFLCFYSFAVNYFYNFFYILLKIN